MTRSFDVDGDDLAGSIRKESVELVTSASQGEVGQGRFIIDDPDGTIATTGWKDVEVAEDTTRIFTGFVHGRRVHRGPEHIARGREITVTTMDGNDLLRRLVIHDTKKRPAETVNARIAWLLTELARVGVSDYGRVQSSGVLLDADKSIKGRYPVDVLAPIAKAISFNYYVRWNADEGGWELVFREPSEEDTCTLAISNVLTDVDGVTTFAPWQEAELSVDPEHVYSGTYSTHDKGNVYLRRASTAAAFTDRDGITEDMSIRKDSTARRDARRFLDESNSEEQTLESVVIKVPPTQVGLVEAGMRISTRMQHMEPEGWDPAVYPNILRLRTGLFTDGDYRLSMDLAPPDEPGESSACPYDLTESGTYGPPAKILPDWSVYEWAVSDGVTYYMRAGLPGVIAPTPGYLGVWHFQTFNYLGAGIDTFASGFGNELRFIVVGDGTMTIQTEKWEGQNQPYTITVEEVVNGTPTQIDSATGTAGDATELDIEAVNAGSCVHIVRLRADARSDSYIGMGWSEMVWVAA